MNLRPSDMLLAVLALLLLLAGASGRHSVRGQAEAAISLEQNRKFVARTSLTDLCLTTEAPYTRNPALADRYSPYQDHPVAQEHFPSGTFIAPPPHH